MCRTVILCSIISSFIFTFANGARILGVITTPSYSHQLVFRPLWRELALKGHEVTLITPDPMRDPALKNLREIDVHFSYGLLDVLNEEFDTNQDMSNSSSERIFVDVFANITDFQLQHPQVKMLIQSKFERFDLVIAEYLHPHAMLAFSERFECPYIGIASGDPRFVSYEGVGNPNHPVLYPDSALGFAQKLTFKERLVSALSYVLMKMYTFEEFKDVHDGLVERHFGKGYPSMQEIFNGVSVLFVYTNPVIHPVRPLVPSVIPIGGGTRLKSSQKLPKNLEEILSQSPKGFIYFSLGTVVKCKDLPEHTLKVLLETFSVLPYIVVWKNEDEIENKPENVFMVKWVPQQAVLAHPNIKLFITHGGLHSLEEAIHATVPVLGMPVARDQIRNVKAIESKGMGIYLDYKKLNETVLKDAILNLVENPMYRKMLKKYSDLMQDQPMTGLEKAVWWTEYVLRHKGAKHLRSPLLDIPSYQYFLLDVIGFCSAIVVIALYLTVLFIRLTLRLFKFVFRKSKSKKD